MTAETTQNSLNTSNEQQMNLTVVKEQMDASNPPSVDNVESSSQSDNKQNTKKKLPASKKTKLKKISDEIPRGKPKSGRPWKSVKQKFSNVKKSIYRRPFEKKIEFRNDLKHIKELSNSIKESRKQENEMKKQRRLANAEKRLENERKAEVVQIIKNPAKLKRMRKKQLRMIEKRDLSKVKVV